MEKIYLICYEIKTTSGLLTGHAYVSLTALTREVLNGVCADISEDCQTKHPQAKLEPLILRSVAVMEG